MAKHEGVFTDAGLYELLFYFHTKKEFEYVVKERFSNDDIQITTMGKEDIYYISKLSKVKTKEHFQRTLKALQSEYRKNNRNMVADIENQQ